MCNLTWKDFEASSEAQVLCEPEQDIIVMAMYPVPTFRLSLGLTLMR